MLKHKCHSLHPNRKFAHDSISNFTKIVKGQNEKSVRYFQLADEFFLYIVMYMLVDKYGRCPRLLFFIFILNLFVSL